jgi:hyperpolarization activated cyclic nucleotide-gated potassium channel 2
MKCFWIQWNSEEILFHPEHPVKILWDLTILGLTLFLTYWIPYSLAFLQDEIPFEMNIFEILITIIYLLDIVVTFNTAVFSKGILIKDRGKIFCFYLKNGFFLDFLSSFPFDWLTSDPLSNNEGVSNNILGIIRMLKFARIFRLLRLIKSRKIFYMIEDYILNEFIAVFYAMLKIGIFLSIVAHWIACIFFFVSVTQVDSTELTWVKVYSLNTGREFDVNELYVTTLYWAFTTMITVGYGDITPQNPSEMVVTLSCMFCSCAYFAYIIGNMGSLISSQMSLEQRKNEIKTGVNKYLKKNDIPKNIQNKVKAFIENLLADISNYQLNDYEVLSLLSHPLRYEILSTLYQNVLNNCQVFVKHFAKETTLMLTKALAIENFSPNDIIFYEKEKLRKLYFICGGQVFILHSKTNLIYKRLEKDMVFGEIGFFVGHARTGTARSMDFTLLQSLDLEDARKYVINCQGFDAILEKLTNCCSSHNYTSLHIYCYLCDCIGHVAKDCTNQKLKSGMETVSSNYINRIHRISNHNPTSDSFPERPKKRKVFPLKHPLNSKDFQKKVENFNKFEEEEKKILFQKQKTCKIIEKIIEESEEEDY